MGVGQVADAAPQLLKPFLKEGCSECDVAAAMRVNLFDGLETAHKEARYAREGVPYIEPQTVKLGTSRKDEYVSFDPGDLIVRRLQHDKYFRQSCRAKSDEWKRGENWCTPPSGMIRGFDDAVAARYHPHLMRPAGDDELQDFRIGALDNADDIEVRCRQRSRQRSSSTLAHTHALCMRAAREAADRRSCRPVQDLR